MRIPSFRELLDDEKCRIPGAGCGGIESYAQGVHPNPQLFKYYWWVFWRESPVDGHEFFSSRYRLSYAAAQALLKEQHDRDEICWLYNLKLPRRDPANPFDANSNRWVDSEWAPAYDDDPDPERHGHK